MTLTNTQSVARHVGDGISRTFGVPFPWQVNADITIMIAANGGPSLTVGTGVSITGAGDPAGGSITFDVAPLAGSLITVLRIPGMTQGLDLVANMGFPSGSVEAALDRGMMVDQALQEQINRSITMDPSQEDGKVFPNPVNGAFIGWNGTELANLIAADFAPSGNIPASLAAWGIGAAAGRNVPPNGLDVRSANDAAQGGIWQTSASVLDTPVLGTGPLLVMPADVGGGAGWAQLWSRLSNGRNYMRTKTQGGTISKWREMLFGHPGTEVGSDLVLYIPSDYPTLHAAIVATRKYKDAYNSIVLMIEAGHQLTRGFAVVDGSYSNYVIKSVSALPTLAAGFAGENASAYLPAGLLGDDPEETENCLFMGINADMPRLACKVDAQGLCNTGYSIQWGGRGFVMPNCGVINAAGHGFSAKSGMCAMQTSHWSGAGGAGIRAAYGSVVAAQNCYANNCGHAAWYDGTDGGSIDVSRGSLVHANSAEINDAGSWGVNVRRCGTINLQDGAEIRNSLLGGIKGSQSSRISAYGIVIQNAGVGGPNLTGTGRGISIETGCEADINGASITGSRIKDCEVMHGAILRCGESGVTTSSGLNQIADYGPSTWSGFNVLSARGIIFNSAA